MATIASATPNYRDTLEALARYIRQHRSMVPPIEAARELLRYDRPGYSHVVGVADGGTTAYLYHVEGRYLIAVAFDGDRLADGGPEIGNFQEHGSIHGWIDRKGSSIGWLHPRYR